MGNTRPILSGQNMTPRFLIWSISTNIPTVLANFLGIHNPVFSKNIGRDRGNTISPQPPLPLRVCECAAPRLLLHGTSYLPTIFYHNTLPFDTAGPKPSHGSSVPGFRPPTPSPTLCLRTRGHMTAVASTNCPTTAPPPPSTAI